MQHLSDDTLTSNYELAAMSEVDRKNCSQWRIHLNTGEKIPYVSGQQSQELHTISHKILSALHITLLLKLSAREDCHQRWSQQ